MARPKTLPVTYGFGLRDRVDPKFAPLGVLAIGRNLRIRKDGRLGARHGYQPIDMSTAGDDLIAYDLHEYRGRLLALGSNSGAGFPTDVYEYVNQETESWAGSDRVNSRVTLSPFRNPREVAGIPQLDDGVSACDAAAGGGHVCLVYTNGLDNTFAIIVDATTDQTIHQEEITNFAASGTVQKLRVVYAEGTFYVAASFASPSPEARVRQFTVGLSTAFTAFASVSGGGPGTTTALDICPVRNATTARLVVATDAATATDLKIVVFDSAGSQVGSTITVSGTNTIHVSIDADQTDNTINVFTVETATDTRLRTFNFSGSLLDGPTTLTSGATGYICRLPALGSFVEHVAIAVNDASSNVVVQFRDVDTHGLTSSQTVQRAVCASRLLSAQAPGLPTAVAFSGVVGADLSTFEAATNALFYIDGTSAHMATRDILTGEQRTPFNSFNLTRDTLTGQLCWVAYRDPGVGIRMPVVTALDFQSTERLQSATFGGLLYFAGATPWVYDGRFPVVLNFNERPAIISATPSNGSGSLSPNATYTYVINWEYTLADGSVMVGPASLPLEVSTGAGQDTVTLSVTTPHTVSVALGSSLFGASVSIAVYRTNWNATASIPGSVLNLTTTRAVTIGLTNYGKLQTIIDGVSDSDNSDNPILYTQNDRGPISQPLQHEAPLACEHIAATEARLLTGGLTRRALLQVSKAAYLDEAIEFNQTDVYFSKVADDITGLASLDGARLAFTRDSIYALGGDGPDDIGVGTLSAPVEIPSPGGLRNPWSFLKAPDGLWFQLDDTKLFRIPRGGGSPTWEGIDVHDTLTAYPVMAGAARHRGDNVGLFACSNEAGTDGRVVVRDFRTEQWFVDDAVSTTGDGITAITSFGDTVAYVSGGNVYTQALGSFTDGTGAFITTKAKTHPLYPFGVGGYGQIYELLLTGEYRGDCQVLLSVSYDDGQTFTDLEAFDLVDLNVGQTVQRKWTLPQDITSSLVVDFTVQNAPARGPTEGFVFNQLDLLVGPEEGLRELAPDEQA